MVFPRTLLVWIIGLPITAVLFTAVLAAYVLCGKGGPNAVHAIATLWFKIILKLSGVKVSVRGAEFVPKDTPVIFLSNHQGAFDIPVLQGYIPHRFRWVAKKSLFKIPVVGWSMSMAGYIPIEREAARKASKSIDDAAEKIKNGASVLVFPEGTRSTTGQLLPFKRGGFSLAVRSGAPVIPVAITGTRDIMKRGKLSIRPADVDISIGAPIPTKGMDEKILQAAVRTAIEELLKGR
ncbi:MAG: 1-acyl-sn-glycerol-3-phosphate acyltransferase [Deltaproteobacteria bacterium]|nr:1-acyl-sn-glycerol-3-phosphate acyltransferase [Deltaproteobacteria bacterium]